jgi:hypothetical protein
MVAAWVLTGLVDPMHTTTGGLLCCAVLMAGRKRSSGCLFGFGASHTRTRESRQGRHGREHGYAVLAASAAMSAMFFLRMAASCTNMHACEHQHCKGGCVTPHLSLETSKHLCAELGHKGILLALATLALNLDDEVKLGQSSVTSGCIDARV